MADRAAPPANRVDPFSPAFYLEDPYSAYQWLHQEAPVHWVDLDDGGFWVLSRHADCVTAARTPEVFSSAEGVVPRCPETDMINTMMAGSVICSEDPRHRELRRSLLGPFRVDAISALESTIRAQTRQLMDAIEPGVPFDLVATVAAPLPTWVVGEVLGEAEDQRERLARIVDAVISFHDPEAGFESVGADAFLEGYSHFFTTLADRRSCPRNDVMSGLLGARVDGRELDDGEIVQSTFIVLVAGTETVRNLISNGIVALLDAPDQWDFLRSDPAVVPTAVEELLRFVTPANYFCRTLQADREVAGVTMRSGDTVMLLFDAANRDRSVFGHDADRLRLDRQPNPHLAFGFGSHFCLGAQLARLECRVFFEEWTSRFSHLELAGPVERIQSANTKGIRCLPLIAR